MLVAELDSGLSPKVIGLGETPAEGIRRGLLVDLEKTIGSVEAWSLRRRSPREWK